MAPTVYIYARVSSAQQSRWNEGHVSLENQVASMRQYITRKGFAGDVVEVTEVRSGKNAFNQSKLREIVDEVEAGDRVVIYNINRFSRCVADGAILLAELKSRGVEMYSATDDMLLGAGTNAQRNLFFNIALANAQFESEQLGERVKASIAFRRNRGDHIGNPGFGWRCMRQPDGKRVLVRNEDEQQLITRIKRMFATQNTKAIAAKLNSERVTKRGKAWTPSSVRALLKVNGGWRQTQRRVVPVRRRQQPTARPQRKKCIYSLRPIHE